MEGTRRSLRRRQLDAQLLPLGALVNIPVPNGGWIRAVREALGLSLDQYARRLGLASSSTAHQLEQAEMKGSITIRRMRAAAEALGCDLVVTLVPKEPLESVAAGQALVKARQRLDRVQHSMVMEAQSVSQNEIESLVEKTAREILTYGGSHLWD